MSSVCYDPSGKAVQCDDSDHSFWQWLNGLVAVLVLTAITLFVLVLAIYSFGGPKLWDMKKPMNRALVGGTAGIAFVVCIVYTIRRGPQWLGERHV